MLELAIIGAGMAGVTLAKSLPGIDLIILEKSRGVGGRIASRRLGEYSMNHGCPIPGVSDPHERIKAEVQGLPIRRGWEVVKINHLGAGYELTSLTGEKLIARKLVITAPAPQAKNLLETAGLEASALEAVTYKGQIQFFALTKGRLTSLSSELELVEEKEVSLGLYLQLFKLRGPWVEDDKEALKINLMSLVREEIFEAHVHKWRYAEVLTTLPVAEQLRFRDKDLYLVGDYFGAGGLEGTKDSVQRVLASVADFK